MKKNRSALWLLLLLGACGTAEKEVVEQASLDSSEIQLTQQQFDSNAMEWGTLSEQVFDDAITVSGQIDAAPQDRAEVHALLGGYIKEIYVAMGQEVRKGQPVAVIEQAEFIDIQKDYLEVYEQLQYLKSEFERQKLLYEEKISSQKVYLQAQSSYRSAQAQLTSLKSKLDLLGISSAQVLQRKFTSQITLVAPLSGSVTRVDAAVGKFVSPSEPIVEILNSKALYLSLKVFEKDANKIVKGQKISFQVPESSEQVYEGIVNLVSKALNPSDRTLSVNGLLIEKGAETIYYGMFVEAKIALTERKANGIPAKALLTQDQKHFVYVLEEARGAILILKKIEVELLAKNERYVEITAEGLKNSSKILVNGVYELQGSGE